VAVCGIKSPRFHRPISRPGADDACEGVHDFAQACRLARELLTGLRVVLRAGGSFFGGLAHAIDLPGDAFQVLGLVEASGLDIAREPGRGCGSIGEGMEGAGDIGDSSHAVSGSNQRFFDQRGCFAGA